MRSALFLAVLLLGNTVGAQESASRIKMEAVKDAPSPNDIDEMITNPQLRATSGSKSRWSLATIFNYSGGTIHTPLAEDRPNIGEQTGINPKAYLDGQISAKYNLNSRHSLLAGTGLRWIAPLAGKPRDYNGSIVDVSNPYMMYQYLYKVWGIESVTQIQPMVYTAADLVYQGYVGGLTLSQDSVYSFGDTGLSVGVNGWLLFQAFNKTGPLGQPSDPDYMEDVGDAQSDYSFSIAPLVEYEFNDYLSFRAVTTLWTLEHLRSQRHWNTYKTAAVTQSIGVGISVTRDIYLYPNVQFLPERIRADRTNVALNTNINLF